jgi:hypothetical protein
LKHLKALTQLLSLDLKGTKITDAGLEHLKGLDNLFELDLLETDVTDEGIKMLLRELPKCRVRWSPKPPACEQKNEEKGVRNQNLLIDSADPSIPENPKSDEVKRFQ